MIPVPRTIKTYVLCNGDDPFQEWFLKLRDRKAKALIQVRLDRVELGNLGDHRWLGPAFGELRIHFGPGYRIYFGEDGPSVVLLLVGGDKSSQSADIRKAKGMWEEYRSRE